MGAVGDLISFGDFSSGSRLLTVQPFWLDHVTCDGRVFGSRTQRAHSVSFASLFRFSDN